MRKRKVSGGLVREQGHLRGKGGKGAIYFLRPSVLSDYLRGPSALTPSRVCLSKAGLLRVLVSGSRKMDSLNPFQPFRILQKTCILYQFPITKLSIFPFCRYYQAATSRRAPAASSTPPSPSTPTVRTAAAATSWGATSAWDEFISQFCLI